MFLYGTLKKCNLLIIFCLVDISNSNDYSECPDDGLCPKDVNALWNKSSQRPSQLQAKYCPQICRDNKTIGTNRTCFDAECFSCDCMVPRCQIYGTCCPSVDGDRKQNATSAEDDHFFQLAQPRELKCDWSPEEFYLHVSSCPMNYRNDAIRRLCETDDYDPENILETRSKVSDETSGVSYYNKFCALCNNVLTFKTWNISIHCYHYLNVYKATSDHELLKLSLDIESQCELKDNPPHKNYWKCKEGWFEDFIDSCNVTADWAEYDADIEHNCLMGPRDVIKRVSIGSRVYKNIFCALCNLKKLPRSGCPSTDSNNNVIPSPPFTLLLNMRRKDVNNQDLEELLQDCSDAQLQSHYICPTIHCSEGKLFYNNTCITALPEIRGLAYRMVTLYEFYNISYFSEDDFLPNISEVILKSLESWADGVLGDWALESNVMVTTTASSALIKLIRCCLTVGPGYYQYRENMTRSMFHEKLLSVLVHYVSIDFIANGNRERDEVENYFTEILTQGEIQLNLGDVSLFLKYISDQASDAMVTCKEGETFCFTSGPIRRHDAKVLRDTWKAKDAFLTMNAVLTCPHVVYNQSDFEVEIVDPEGPWKKSIQLKLGEITLEFSNHKELASLTVTKSGTLKICYDLLKNKIAEKKKNRLANTIHLSQYILTLACLSVSMVCLALTVSTYLSFSVLRNVAGMHNLFLSLSLLLSQASLLVSVHVNRQSAACTAVGVITHFLWLMMFCWSFLCCFHMYSIFKSKNRAIRANSHGVKLLMAKRGMLSILIPTAVVSTVIAGDYILSGGQRLGYGHKSCYLNSANLVLASLGAPMACVLSLNSFFFLSSVYEIYKIRKLQSRESFRKDERHQMCVYMKLSTLTGVFWGVAMLSEALDNEPLRFISILLNGLQGLFIMASYIGNMKVLTLYLQCFGRLLTPPATETSLGDHGTSNYNNQ